MTAAAVSNFCGENSGTSNFIQLITKWWTIVNVKRPITFILKRNALAAPFTSTSDERLVFFVKFFAVLKEMGTN